MAGELEGDGAEVPNDEAWIMGSHTDAAIRVRNLTLYLKRGGSLKDLIHHSDRSVQYACRDYALRLSQIGGLR